MSELAWKLALLFGVAGLGAILGAYCLAALFRRRDPVLYGRTLPPITAAMEHDLLGRDNDPTRGILMGSTYVSGRPMRPLLADVGQPPLAIEAAPVVPSRSRS